MTLLQFDQFFLSLNIGLCLFYLVQTLVKRLTKLTQQSADSWVFIFAKHWDELGAYWAVQQQISWVIAPWWIFSYFSLTDFLLLTALSRRLERHLHFASIKLCQASWMWYRFGRYMSLSLLFSSSIQDQDSHQARVYKAVKVIFIVTLKCKKILTKRSFLFQ